MKINLTVEEVTTFIILGMERVGYHVKTDQINYDLSCDDGKAIFNGCVIDDVYSVPPESIYIPAHDYNNLYPAFGQTQNPSSGPNYYNNPYADFARTMNPSLEPFPVKRKDTKEK